MRPRSSNGWMTCQSAASQPMSRTRGDFVEGNDIFEGNKNARANFWNRAGALKKTQAAQAACFRQRRTANAPVAIMPRSAYVDGSGTGETWPAKMDAPVFS